MASTYAGGRRLGSGHGCLFLSKYECTQAQWARLTGDEPPSYFQAGAEGITTANPVESVSWEDCVGRPGWLLRYGLLLPTEAQWEYACRAPVDADGRRDDTYSPWSGAVDAEALLDVAWIDDNSETHTWPVGRKVANRFGLHDMHGNVWEWCRDVYDAEYYAKQVALPTAQRKDPQGPEGSGNRVFRGGSWNDPAGFARSAFRLRVVPVYRALNLGVRPARAVTSN